MTTKEICANLDKIINSVPDTDTDIQRIAREALTRLRHQEEELHTMREVSIAHKELIGALYHQIDTIERGI